MAGTTSRVGYQTYNDGEDWEYNTDFQLLDKTTPKGLADNGTITLSGGSTPAVNTTITDVSSTQTSAFRIVVGVNSDPSFDADYAFNYDFSAIWDDSDGSWDIEITVNWDTDPGSSNDITAFYRVYEE